MTEKLIQYLSTKKEEVHVLLNVSGDSSFQSRVMHVAEKYIAKQLEEFEHIDKELFSYLTTFIISGSVQVMKLWLNEDKEKTPKEMAILITNLINNGIYGTIR
jgi:nucleoside diphosphate kinase